MTRRSLHAATDCVQAVIIEDGWLGAVCGRACFSVSKEGLAAPVAVVDALLQAANTREAFAYAKVPTNEVGVAARLAQAGFTVVDTGVMLERGGGAVAAQEGVQARRASFEQFSEIEDIAGRCFRTTRFHLDPLFPDTLANEIKRAWLRSYCRQERGDALYAVDQDGTAAGFLAALAIGPQGHCTAVIDLVGVAPEFQGRGLGRALVSGFIEDWRGKATVLRVGTQAANTTSLRCYESLGFRAVGTTYVLHAHVQDGKLVRC